MSKYKIRKRSQKGPAFQPARTSKKQQAAAAARKERRHARRNG